MLRAKFIAANDANFTHAGGTPASFNNQRNFNRRSVAGETIFFTNVALNNTGTVTVEGGSLELNGGGTTTQPGAFDARGLAQVIIDGGTYTLNNAAFFGEGIFAIEGGTVEVRGTVGMSNFTLSTGTLTGAGTLDVFGDLNWSGGTMGGSGVTNADGRLFILGFTGKTLQQRTLNTRGAVTWSDSGNIGMEAGAVFNNFRSFTAENNQFFGVVGASGSFNNFGTFTKSGSSGTTTFMVPFKNLRFTNSDGMVVSAGTVSASSGVINFARGYNQTAGALILAGGSLTGTLDIEGGSLGGDGNHTGNVNNNGGTAGPGRSPGRLNIVGNYTQGASGALDIEIGGAGAGQFDQLAVSNAANLGGTLNISLLDGFQPAVGDTFTILTYASRSGAFNTINGLTLPGGRSFEADFRADRLTLITRGASTPTLQFSAATYTVGEGEPRALVTVTRTGDTSGSSSVDYMTVDDPAAIRCDDTASLPNVAFARCDYATSLDTLTFAPGETEKTFTVPIINDAHVEPSETFTLRLLNPTGAALGAQATAVVQITETDVAGQPNPILTVPFFVRLHYLDFLSREPEATEPWSAILNGCPDVFNLDPASPSASCDRILVSFSFFGSPEFRLKGFYVFTHYRVAFNRLAEYTEIAADLRAVTGQTPADTFARRAQFPVSFTQRPEFRALYDGLTNQQFVDALLNRYSLQQLTTPDPQNPEGTVKVALTRADLVNRLGATGAQALTRAQVLRAIVESDEVAAAEFTNAFVATQYYGYLRRTPEPDGFNAWLRYLSDNPTDFRTMVNGFLNSIEYRLRFGQP